MNKKYYMFGIILFIATIVSLATSEPIESTIPPTPAFLSINGTNGSIIAENYKSNLELVEGSNISFTFDNILKKLTISTTGTDGGENNTASNIGQGEDIFKQKAGINLEFKGIVCNSPINCTNDNTDVIISHDTTQRESMVGVWTVDSIKTNIGTSFADVYITGQGDPLRIDTNGKTTATLIIDWTKIGIGTQTCQIVSTTNNEIVLITIDDLSSGLNINETQDIPANAENITDTFKPQCKSTVGLDAPIWLTGQVLLK